MLVIVPGSEFLFTVLEKWANGSGWCGQYLRLCNGGDAVIDAALAGEGFRLTRITTVDGFVETFFLLVVSWLVDRIFVKL